MASPRLAHQPAAPLEAVRQDLTARECQAEGERQATLRAKNAEIDSLAKKWDEHRQQVNQIFTGNHVIVSEAKAMRDNTQSAFRTTKAKGAHDIGVADRALARAGQVALSARLESEKWQAMAGSQELLTRMVKTRTEESFRQVQEASAMRVAEVRAHGEERAYLAAKLTGEHAANQEQIRQRHLEGQESQELTATQSAFQKMSSAERTRRDADVKVRAAMDKSAKDQTQSISMIHDSHKAAEEKVQDAKQKLAAKRWEHEATLASERICTAQAQSIAAAMKEYQEFEREVDLKRLEEKFRQVTVHAQNKTSLAQAEIPIARERNEAWLLKMSRDLDAAHARVADENVKASQRVDAAKLLLGELQAKCKAYISDLLEQWEKAKRSNETKVAAAKAQTEELAQYCQETLQKCEKRHGEMIKSTEEFARRKKSYMEDHLSGIDDMAKSRVAMAQQQSRERREHAERRLAQLQEHIEDVKARCDQRAQADAAAAAEKVRIAQERFQENIHRLELRAREAEHLRSEARTAHAKVVVRCRGVAMEAHRRGLDGIAALLDVKSALPKPGTAGQVGSLHQSSTASVECPSPVSLRPQAEHVTAS